MTGDIPREDPVSIPVIFVLMSTPLDKLTNRAMPSHNVNSAAADCHIACLVFLALHRQTIHAITKETHHGPKYETAAPITRTKKYIILVIDFKGLNNLVILFSRIFQINKWKKLTFTP